MLRALKGVPAFPFVNYILLLGDPVYNVYVLAMLNFCQGIAHILWATNPSTAAVVDVIITAFPSRLSE